MDLFIELLQISMGNGTTFSRKPSDNEWEALLAESQQQAVTGVMLDGLEQLSPEQCPPQKTLFQWIAITQKVEQTALQHRERARNVTQMLKVAGYSSCILRGLSSASRYLHPLRRGEGCIDIWIKGDKKKITHYIGKRHHAERAVYHHSDIKISDNIKTKVHYQPSCLYNPLHNFRLQHYYDKQIDKQVCQGVCEYGYVITTAAFDAAYQLIHIFHQLIEERISIKHIIDYYYVLVQLDKERKEICHGQANKHIINDIVTFINSLGLRKFLGGMMYVMEKVCGASKMMLLYEPDEMEGRFLLEQILLTDNFGHQRNGEYIHRKNFKFYQTMLRHYPNEVAWILPWKFWHVCWRRLNSYLHL